MNRTVLALIVSLSALPALAAKCDRMNYQPGKVIDVQSSISLGTRIQLPGKISRAPMITNGEWWDVGGQIGTNQIFIAPNSMDKNAASTMVFVFTEDGKVYDILAKRVKDNKHKPCVLVAERHKFVFKEAPVSKLDKEERPVMVEAQKAESQLKTAMAQYRQQIFANYNWKRKGGNSKQPVVSDVYDDGRKTFIRLYKPNQTGLTVVANINGQIKKQPLEKSGSNMVSFAGVFNDFVITSGETKITVTR